MRLFALPVSAHRLARLRDLRLDYRLPAHLRA
jgi:hypothetical protein